MNAQFQKAYAALAVFMAAGTAVETRAQAQLVGGQPAGSQPPAMRTPAPVKARNVALVHGAWADGSRREKVIPILQAAGLHVTAVQNPVVAWHDRPTFYAVSKQDTTIAPELERFLAQRMGATTIEVNAGHLSMVSQPQAIANLILEAAGWRQ